MRCFAWTVVQYMPLGRACMLGNMTKQHGVCRRSTLKLAAEISRIKCRASRRLYDNVAVVPHFWYNCSTMALSNFDMAFWYHSQDFPVEILNPDGQSMGSRWAVDGQPMGSRWANGKYCNGQFAPRDGQPYCNRRAMGKVTLPSRCLNLFSLLSPTATALHLLLITACLKT